jgi:hypothetical protein
MKTGSTIAGIVVLLTAGSALAAVAEFTPIWQLRFAAARAQAENADLEQEDLDELEAEAMDFGPFDPHLVTWAGVDGASASGIASQQSEVLPNAIVAYGAIYLEADAREDSTFSQSSGTSWMEVSFTIDLSAEVELFLHLMIDQGAGVAVQLWEDTPDGSVLIRGEQLTAPGDSLVVTHSETLEPGEYRLRGDVQGVTSDGGADDETGFAFGFYDLELSILHPGCVADLDGDGDTDQADLGVLLGSFGVDAGGDLDGDGDTDQADLGVLLGDFDCE